eukprot:COSAG01_NODE_8940_length_2608_cov_1.708250_2_plen_290_part_00
MSVRTREGTNKYHHAECYSRGDPSSFYGFASLDPAVRAALLSGRRGSSRPPAASTAAAAPPLCSDPFCAHGTGCPGRASPASKPSATAATVAAPCPKGPPSPPEPREYGFEVVGWSFNKASVLGSPGGAPRAGEQLCVSRQPSNEYDAQALEVTNGAGQRLGFLPRQLSALLSPAVDAGALQLSNARCQSWERAGWAGSCVLRVTITPGVLPPGAAAMAVALPPRPNKRKAPAPAPAPAAVVQVATTKGQPTATEGGERELVLQVVGWSFRRAEDPTLPRPRAGEALSL